MCASRPGSPQSCRSRTPGPGHDLRSPLTANFHFRLSTGYGSGAATFAKPCPARMRARRVAFSRGAVGKSSRTRQAGECAKSSGPPEGPFHQPAMHRSSRKLRHARRPICGERKAVHVGLGMCACLIGQPALPADNPAEALELQRVEVIGTTPLPGLGTPLKDVPANVQVYGSKDLAKQRPGSLAEFLQNNPTSVTVNAAQGNPYQPDISFRGFTASPLVGVPQGLSVFQDGVRINEPFGDVVNWDLLPAVRHRQHPAPPRFESALRAQHAGRRPRDLHEERAPVSRWLGRDLGRIVRPPDPAGRARGRVGPLGLLPHRQRFAGPRLAQHNPSLDRPVLRQGRLRNRARQRRRQS